METVSCTAHDARKRYHVALIATDRDWRPAAWNDAPPTAVIREVVASCATRAEAEGWVFGFNTNATADDEGWAVILKCHPRPQPGRRYVRQCPVFTEVGSMNPR